MKTTIGSIHCCLLSFQAEQRADLAERTMAKLQKEVDRLEGNGQEFLSRKHFPNVSHRFLDELLVEKEKYKSVSEELDMTLNELSGY